MVVNFQEKPLAVAGGSVCLEIFHLLANKVIHELHLLGVSILLTVGVGENNLKSDGTEELVEDRPDISLIKAKIVEASLAGWISFSFLFSVGRRCF